MRWMKLSAIVSLWLFFFGVLAIVHLCISVLRLPNRWKIVSRWTRGFTWLMRRMLNIKITVEGDAGQLGGGGYVIISNHLGYLDGIVLGSLFPVIFVSKKEVKSWPLVGQWTTLCGTVFINRQKKAHIPLAVTGISQRLKQRANILLFPEGAATNGERMFAVPDRSIGRAFTESGDYRTGYLGLPKYRGTTDLGNQQRLNLLLRRYGFWHPLFEASRVAAGRSQGHGPPESRLFPI
jgi:1-acyl-sn-glycerol-3-phosphate acyltransferase